MEAKDYTNIAGSPFQPYVQTQIEQRKKIVSEENRTYKELQWLTNKNAWIRISSGADVTDDNTYFKNFKDDALSRKYILQAGLTDHSGDSFNLRSGLGPDGAYNIGGTDINEKTDEKFFNTNIISSFGFRPMPGLTSLTIGTGGKLGTLREASFEFTCYTMEQLNIMNSLYMKLGFSILIEYGHIPFLNNNGDLKVTPTPLDFYKIETKEELMKAIQDKRVEHSGNYDALWGTVKNFSYTFENNGEFKCKVDLVGAGDILESLKINQSNRAANNINVSGSDNYPVVADANKSLLNEALYNYYNETIKATGSTPIFSFPWIYTQYFKKLGINFNDFSANTDLVRKGYQYSLLSGVNQNNGNPPVNIPDLSIPEYYFSTYKMDLEIESEETKPESQVYITLGHLMLLTLATGGIYDKVQSKENPYIYIDVNNETNRCYTFPGHCSLDPTVCLIGSEGLPFSITSDIFTQIQNGFPFFTSTTSDLGGKPMWILVNINYVVETLRKHANADKKGKVNFVDFMQDILSGISKACGGFNEFRLVPDDDTRCVRLFDDRMTSKYKVNTDKLATIPVLGKNSLAYNFSYSSKISPEMATQIVIAAQAQDQGIQGSKDALSFSHLNKGLKNRLSPTIVEATTPESGSNVLGQTLSNYIELRDLITFMYSGTSNSSLLTPEVIQAQENILGITKTEGGTLIVPEGSRKSYLQTVVEAVYESLKNKTQNLKPLYSEDKILALAKDNAKNYINDSKVFVSAGDNSYRDIFIKSESDPSKYFVTRADIERYAYELMAIEYKEATKEYKKKHNVKFGLGDSDIENIWEESLKKRNLSLNF